MENSATHTWGGTCTLPGQPPVWIRVDTEQQTYDVPAWDWFDRPYTPEPGGAWQLAGLGRAELETTPAGMTGLLTRLDGPTGQLQLYPQRTIRPGQLEQVAGAYEFPDGLTMIVFGSCGAEAKDFDLYYRLGDRVVRLQWIAGQTYLSELAERLEFADDGIHITAADGSPQHAAPLALYHTQTHTIASPSGHSLQGDLLLPADQPGPYTVVVLVHGAGPELRQDYLNFACYFLERGLAVFTYDKRGWGKSTGEELWSQVYELAEDAALVVRHLQQLPDVRQVGLCGFSNGGWVGPLAASRSQEVAFVIALSGSGVPPARQEQMRRGNVAREVLGATPAQVQQVHEIWEYVFPFLATGEWTEGFERVCLMLENDPALQALPRHAGMPDGLQPVPPRRTRAEWQALGGTSPDMIFDPAPVFAALDAPLLCVWGAGDSLVPVEESRQALEKALQAHPDFHTLLLPDTGHQLFLLPKGADRSGDESQRLKKSVRVYAPGVWQQITTWAANRSQARRD